MARKMQKSRGQPKERNIIRFEWVWYSKARLNGKLKRNHPKGRNRESYRTSGEIAIPNQSLGTGACSEKVGNNRIKTSSGTVWKTTTREPIQQGSPKENICKDGIGKATKLIAMRRTVSVLRDKEKAERTLATTGSKPTLMQESKSRKGSLIRIGMLSKLAAKLRTESLYQFGTLSAVRVSRDKRNRENAGNSRIEATLVQIRKMEQGSLKG